MYDDFLGRDGADKHHLPGREFDKLIRRAASAVDASFDALTRAQFDAPWRQTSSRRVRISGPR